MTGFNLARDGGRASRRPPFDPELAPIVQGLAAVIPPMTDDTYLTMRQAMLDGTSGLPPVDLTASGAIDVQERQVSGPEGAPKLTLLVLTPARATPGLRAVIYHIHGGGMVVGDRRANVDDYLPVVAEGSAVVVSVEYRLAPEHPDPAPLEDCYAGLVWVADHAADLGVDPDRLIVAGVSAGGGLAAGVVLLARDRGFPTVAHQVLICPMLDDRLESASSRMLDGEGVWDRNDNLYGWTALLGERRGGPDVSPYSAPARAEDLTGCPGRIWTSVPWRRFVTRS